MNLLIENIRGLSYALVSPTLSLMLIVIAIIFYFKNRKIAFMQKLMLGRSIQSPLEMTLLQILIGILGGLIASLLLSILGVTFENSSLIDVILTVSVFSVLYKNRFLESRNKITEDKIKIKKLVGNNGYLKENEFNTKHLTKT